MQPLVRVRTLSKTYRGVSALESIDLDLLPHTIYGLVGRNGSGKTTLLASLTG